MNQARTMILKKVFLPVLLMAMLLPMSQSAGAVTQLNRFEVGSYQEILELNQGDAFLMVLWSLECPPCIEELVTLGQFHRQNPEAKIVLVSTDRVMQQEEIARLMQKHGLENVQQWIFDGDSEQALRYAIDPSWYGELPRSYFYQDNHQREARSGRLDDEVILAWYRAVNKP